MKQKVAYIHVHTKYSIRDGIAEFHSYVNRIEELNKNSKKYEIIGVSSTEHGNFYSMTNANQELLEKNLTHMIGCEVYHTDVVNDFPRNKNSKKYHLVLIATDNKSKSNLFRLGTYAGSNKYKGSFKEYAIADEQAFKKFGKGLIATTACAFGLIPTLIREGKYEEAKAKAIEYNNIFEQLYLEIQPHESSEQININNTLIKISEETGIPLVMGVDTHYLNKEDQKYYKMLKSLNFLNSKSGETEDEESEYFNHLRSFEELEEYCVKYNIPLECLSNTKVIADSCTATLKPETSKGYMPSYPVPRGYTEESYLSEISLKRLIEKCEEKNQTDVMARIKRLNYELDIINNNKFAGYFLIIASWIDYCRKNNIPTGPGRGSAASSLVNYVNSITKIDPIKYHFIFARFLNDQRLEAPDIDTDVGSEERPKAVEYFQNTYGTKYVSQIITFSKYGIRGIFQEAGKFVGIPASERDYISKQLPNSLSLDDLEDIYNNQEEERNMSEKEIKEAIKAYELLQDVFNQYPKVYDIVGHLKGLIRSTSVHAGGVLISGVELDGNFPMELSTSSSAVLPLIQVEMHDIPFYSLLKLDLLGLQNCSIINIARKEAGLGWDWYDSENFDDPNVYEFLLNGNTQDVFQLSSSTPTSLIKRFKTKSIEDLFAVNSCNRPGPLQVIKSLGKSMVQMFEEGANGVDNSTGIECVDNILKDTYSCIIYQEQCQRIGQELAGYSLGGADIRIRKTLGKKIVSKIPEIEVEFLYGEKPLIKNIKKNGDIFEIIVFKNDKGEELISDDYNTLYDKGYRPVPSGEKSKYNSIGCVNNGYKDKLDYCIKIFDIIRAMATYCFNLAHSGAYSSISYKCAELSYYYPLEYTYGCLSVYDKKEKKIKCISNARKKGVIFLPPNINSSMSKISILKKDNKNHALIFGFSDLERIGEKAGNIIVAERLSGGVYKSFDDFLNRIITNKTETVINAAGLNSKGKPNSTLNKTHINVLIKAGAFDSFDSNRHRLLNYYNSTIRKDFEWRLLDETNYLRCFKLEFEKETMGFYCSEHPLDPFPYVDFTTVPDDSIVIFTALVKKKTTKTTKGNKKYLNLLVETKDSTEISVKLFGKTKTKYSKLLKEDTPFVIHGRWSAQYGSVSCSVIEELIPVDDMSIGGETDMGNYKSPVIEGATPTFPNISFFDGIHGDIASLENIFKENSN